VIDHPISAVEISPSLGRALGFSLMLGLACGVGLALFLEALDDTLHSPEDISAYTEAAFLGMVPLLEDPTQGLITVLSPKSPPAEAYRTLRSNIHFAQVDHPAQTFLVTSAGAGEGKTMTTANLAAVFAQAGQEVLLIDTDLRRPSLHRIFNLPSDRGLTNVLVGETTLDDVILDTEVPGLRLVPTGPLPPNPAELLESEQMNRIIARARDVADVVFFDSPPAIVLTDAVILSSKIERVILVAEAGQVTRDAFNEMCRLIANARGTILGVVLNKLRLSAGDYYYYYYYYDYSHYAPRRGVSTAPDMAAASTTGQPQQQPGFTSADAPSMLEEIFGPQDSLPQLPQTPPVSLPEPPPLAPPSEEPDQEIRPPDVPTEPPRSPLENLFGPQDGNDN
jgi:capsular exopolysaccharide synthesis family protein